MVSTVRTAQNHTHVHEYRLPTLPDLCIEHFRFHVQRPKSIMAALPFVGTLDSDDEVEQVDDETESEDEQEEVIILEN